MLILKRIFRLFQKYRDLDYVYNYTRYGDGHLKYVRVFSGRINRTVPIN